PGSPTGFTRPPTAAPDGETFAGQYQLLPQPPSTARGVLDRTVTPRLWVTSTTRPKSGPFPPPALPGFHGTTSLSATPRRPDRSLAGGRLGRRPTAGASRVCVVVLCRHAVATTPVGPQAGSGRSPDAWDSGLPRCVAGSAPTLCFSRPARRSRRLRPACSRNR